MNQLRVEDIICCTYGNDNGVSIRYCGPQFDYITREMMAGRFYEKWMLQWICTHLPHNLVFVDAGAHIGVHTLYFAIACKAAKVYAFEPHPLSFWFLRGNIIFNKATNVTASQFALGTKLGRARLLPSPTGDPGGTRVKMMSGGRAKVTPLDLVVHDMVDVVKIDAEGSSLAILKGARKVLARGKPDLFVECGQKDDQAAIDAFLTSFGYVRLHRFNPTPTYLYSYPGASRVNGMRHNESDSAT